VGKPQFAAIPNRALWDRELTDRDVRNLAVIAAHDRLSHARGTGQGAWASHKRFAALAGTEYSRFSVSVNRLLARGYLNREPLATDRRKFTYRVIYTDEDSLPSSKELPAEIVCSDANEDGEIVCSDPELSGCEQSETDAQYISRREGIDSAEAGKIDSENQRVLANAPARQWEDEPNVGGQLARLERALSAGEIIDRLAWYQYLESAIGDEDESNSGRASRLADKLVEAMDEDEYAQWGLEHGWVDDEGHWHCPHPRDGEEIAGGKVA
jgi:hypothetical protein